jgi:hypothetical protein
VAVSVRVEINNRFITRLLKSPAGPLARHMLTRGNRVQREARRRINSRSGRLARSITVSVVVENGGAGVRVGTDLFYARFVHDGTGVYGPSQRPIRPRRGRALAFPGRAGHVVVASSAGQPGTGFLREALRAAG